MRNVILSLSGAVGGAVAAVIWGPELIHYWAQPPFPMGCDCGPGLYYAMHRLLWIEGIFIIAGGVVVPLALGPLFRGKAKEKAS